MVGIVVVTSLPRTTGHYSAYIIEVRSGRTEDSLLGGNWINKSVLARVVLFSCWGKCAMPFTKGSRYLPYSTNNQKICLFGEGGGWNPI